MEYIFIDNKKKFNSITAAFIRIFYIIPNSKLQSESGFTHVSHNSLILLTTHMLHMGIYANA